MGRVLGGGLVVKIPPHLTLSQGEREIKEGTLGISYKPEKRADTWVRPYETPQAQAGGLCHWMPKIDEGARGAP